MFFINMFQLCSKERCSHKECMFKGVICWEKQLLKFNFIFCFCSPILLNGIFHDVICLVNNDAIFICNIVNVEEFILDAFGRYRQMECQTLALVFQRRFSSLLT